MSAGDAPNGRRGATPIFFANPYLLWLSIVIVLAGGLLAFAALPRLEDPRITQRNAIILVAMPGAPADRIEALISEPIELALDEIPEIKEVTSTSRSGFASISIELQDAITTADNTKVFAEIRDKLSDVEARFPAEALPAVFDENRGAVAFTKILAITWDMETEPNLAIMSRVGDDLAASLREVPGTELVRIYGAPSEEIAVYPDSTALALYGIDAARFAQALRRSDSEASGGTIIGADNELQLDVAGDFDGVSRIMQVPVLQADGRRVTAGDLADIRRTIAEPLESMALRGGERAIFVAARMDENTQVSGWNKQLDAAIARFNDYGGGTRVEEVFDQSVYTTERLGDLFGNLLLGIAVVVLVVTVLMGWRSAILVSASIPLVGAATLFSVSSFGGQLHQMSVFGMIVALGILIDNAIVVVDESQRNLARGVERSAVMRATLDQLFIPLLASTITTVIAFLPIVLLPGGSGDFVRWIGLSVIIAIIAAFVIAVTIIAALAARYSRRESSDGGWWQNGISGGPIAGFFARTLRLSIRKPLVGIAIALAPPVLGFALLPTLGNEFFPPTDRNMFSIRMTLPSSTSIGSTERFAERMEHDLLQRQGVQRVDTMIGGSFPSVYYNLVMNQDASPNYAHAIVTTTDAAATQRLVASLQEDTPANFPEAQVLVNEFGQGPPATADVEVKIIGPSIEKLQQAGETVQRIMMAHPDVVVTGVTMPRGIPKLQLHADEDEAQSAGIGFDDISSQLRAAVDGIDAGTVREDLQELPVRIRYGEDLGTDPTGVDSFTVISPQGHFVPLDALGHITLVPETAAIMRIDGERANVVRGWVASDALAIDVAEQVLANIEAEDLGLPSNYRLELGGQVEQSSDAQGNLANYAPLLGIAMLATLILTFRSLLLTLPLLVVGIASVGNAFLATWLIAYPISFNTLIGTIGLIGLAFNNSIVVIAAIRADEAARRGDEKAIAEAVERTGRHILSTTLTTVGAFLPLLLLIGGTFWPSLAIVLSGGVFGSMVLSQFLIPASYVLIARWEARRRGDAHGRALPA